jgi:hypothetical protein
MLPKIKINYFNALFKRTCLKIDSKLDLKVGYGTATSYGKNECKNKLY